MSPEERAAAAYKEVSDLFDCHDSMYMVMPPDTPGGAAAVAAVAAAIRGAVAEERARWEAELRRLNRETETTNEKGEALQRWAEAVTPSSAPGAVPPT